MIDTDDYFAGYRGHAGITTPMMDNAALLLTRVRALLEWAVTEGWVPTINQVTGTMVSGQTDGGWRPQECATGAPNSAHKQARAVDVADADGTLDGLITDDALEDFGLYREAPESTRHWCHLTDRSPASGRRTFNP